MPKAVRVHEHGGSDKLSFDDIPMPQAGEGEVLVKNHAIGINYIDTYHRSGLYPVELPYQLGREAAGVVEAVGSGVTEFKVGDKVAYLSGAQGSYCEYNAVPAAKTVPLPATFDFDQGAALLLQGLTAHYLVTGSYRLQAGDTALVHAAAGGVGQILVQLCKIIGAKVIASVGTAEKAEIVKALGADEVIIYTQVDFAAEVARLTDGKKVQVVYDGVGKATFDKSLECLAPLGFMVSFGNASGAVEPFNIGRLAKGGSLSLIRPTLASYIPTRELLLSRTNDLVRWIGEGKLKLAIGARFALSKAKEAHDALESRNTTGKVLLIPDALM